MASRDLHTAGYEQKGQSQSQARDEEQHYVYLSSNLLGCHGTVTPKTTPGWEYGRAHPGARQDVAQCLGQPEKDKIRAERKKQQLRPRVNNEEKKKKG